jgi:hypothetical protein
MTTRVRLKVALVALTVVGVVGVSAAAATGGGSRAGFGARLSGYEEVPAVSTAGGGTFRAVVSRTAPEIRYVLTYGPLGSAAQQAHIHFGQEAVNGDVSVFLCSNLAGAPVGTPACPASGGTVTGTIRAAQVVGPAAQGIAPGEFTELVAAMRAEVTYVNVHTVTFRAGEIRGQVEPGGPDDDENHSNDGEHGDGDDD